MEVEVVHLGDSSKGNRASSSIQMFTQLEKQESMYMRACEDCETDYLEAVEQLNAFDEEFTEAFQQLLPT